MCPPASIAKAQKADYPEQHFRCLKNAVLFSSLAEKDIVPLSATAQALVYKKGKILYIQDESTDFFYVIAHGWIKLFHTTPDGEELVVAMLTSGSTVGVDTLFENGRHTSNAQVVEDVLLLKIPTSVLKEQMRLNWKFTHSMLSAVYREYRGHRVEIATYAMQDAPQRIGNFLLKFCPSNMKKDITFHLPYDKTLIAHTLGMRRGSFSRALNILRQKTAIRINGTRVEIDSVERLTKFVHGS
jgi:CRP-like cAMP-binding protein